MSELTHQQMVCNLAKNGKDIIIDLTPTSAHLWHMATGICTEAGELYEAVFAMEIHDNVDVENLTEELGDAEFYIEGYRQELEIKRCDTLYIAKERMSNIDVYSSDCSYVKTIFAELMMNANNLLGFTKKNALYSKPINISDIVETLAEIEYCLCKIRQSFRISYEDTIKHNINKLATGKNARYSEGKFSNEQAQNRADKA